MENFYSSNKCEGRIYVLAWSSFDMKSQEKGFREVEGD